MVRKVTALFLFTLLTLAGVYFLAPMDRTWPETKRALEARGEVLDWDKIIPPSVAPEENLFEDPVAASLLPIKGQPIPPNPLGVKVPKLPPGSEDLGCPFALSNLVALSRAGKSKYGLNLAELDEWFAQWDESFLQLRAAAKRPKARLLGDYSSPTASPIPNFVAARMLAQMLGSRAKVHLLLGQSAAAFEDLETLEVLMKSFETQPGTLVTAMIHVAVAGLYLETIEDGLRHNLWADAELQKITPRLLEINLFRVVQQGIRAERAGTLRHLTALAERKRDPLYRSTLSAFTSSEWTVERAVIEFSPSSWIRGTQAQYARLLQGYLDAMDPERRVLNQTGINQQNAEFTEIASRWSPKKAILLQVTPDFMKAASTVAKNQMRLHELAIACALQRYQSKNNRYPKTLEQLLPAYISTLPTDVYTGAAIKYQLDGGGYELMHGESRSQHPIHQQNFIWQGE